MIKIGIIGCGVIGNVMKVWLENHTSHIIKVLDPAKGYNDDLSDIDIAFISIHIETESDGSQNLTDIKKIIKSLPKIPIFIRTTLLPGTCDSLSKELQREVYFMPEFLTERTAYDDFCSQAMIYCSDDINLLKKIFPNKCYLQMSNFEAEISKYAHNVFGAVKVTYFNGIYKLCEENNLKFDKVRAGILQSGYINETHTMVPGPDGKFGYGGKCFPKDIKAFSHFVKNTMGGGGFLCST